MKPFCKVVSPGPLGLGTKVLVEGSDGNYRELQGVLEVSISPIEPDDFIVATVKLMGVEVEVGAELLVDLETLERSATALGMKLVKDEDTSA